MFTSRTIYLPSRRAQPTYHTLPDGAVLRRYADGSGCVFHLDDSRSLIEARITDYYPGGPLDWAQSDTPLTVADCLAAWQSPYAGAAK